MARVLFKVAAEVRRIVKAQGRSNGGHFMARAYRATFGRVLQNMTGVERDKLLVAFRASLALASSGPHAIQPC